MRDRGPWPRALMASCIIHCLILAALGWAGAFAVSPAAAEQFIELALVSDAVPRETADINATVTRVPEGAPGKAESTVRNSSDVSTPELTTTTAGGERPVTAG
ncbi:MAG TPA: hypothetical protein VN521_08150, partial [Negativicutes bacterium]|nr:hypothetical protein [Negativicutes bacterium]